MNVLTAALTDVDHRWLVLAAILKVPHPQGSPFPGFLSRVPHSQGPTTRAVFEGRG